MSKIYDDITLSAGNTPLIRFNRVTEGSQALVLAKIEGRNPAFSVKCRVGVNMIRDAEKKGLIKKDTEIIEPTSGNTGIALAFVCAARGYRLTLTMPETMSIERRKVLAYLGANIILTPGSGGMTGAVKKAEEMTASDPGRFYMPQQFKNPANPAVHEATTGPEIWNDTNGTVDVLVSGVGTGGTITGISRFLKNTCGKKITSVAVEPEECPAITKTMAGETVVFTPHRIQGIGAGFVPDNLDLSLIDRTERVSSQDAVEMAKRLAREEGILAGISSGAAAVAAVRLAKLSEYRDKTIVVILPDLAERYLSTTLFEGI